KRTIYFRAWNVTFHCEVPKTPPKGLKRWMDDKKGQKPKRGYVKAQKEEKLEKLVMPNQAVTKATEAVSSATAIVIPSNSTSSNSTKPRNVDKHGSPAYYRELLLSEFEDILVDELPNELPPLHEVNHRIPYKPKKPWIAHKYRLSEAHKKALEQEVAAKLQCGILQYTSNVPLAASHMVRK